jgi:hypothetical protein
MSQAWLFEWKSPNSLQEKNEVEIIVFDIKRILYKEFVLAGQTVNST